MNSRSALVLIASCALFVSACWSSFAPPAAPAVEESVTSTARGGDRQKTVTIRATVVEIDQKARRITLKGFDGATVANLEVVVDDLERTFVPEIVAAAGAAPVWFEPGRM